MRTLPVFFCTMFLKRPSLRIAILVGTLLVCNRALADYDLSGDWAGTCNQQDIDLTITQSEAVLAGTLVMGDADYTLQGSVSAETAELTGTCPECVGLRSCSLQCQITSGSEMTCALRRSGPLGFTWQSCSTMLYNKEKTIRFDLDMGHVQEPSNIYLFFSVENYAGEPLTGLREEDFEIYEDESFISLYESRQTILPNPSLYTLDTVLLLDMSGSILESETLEPLKDSAQLFLSKISGNEGQEVAIYLFDGRETIRELIGFTKNVSALQTAVESLSKSAIINDPEYDISTNLNGAVEQGLALLDAKREDIAAGQLFTGSLITFTDGTDQANRVPDSEAVEAVRKTVFYSFAIGLGGEIDESHLSALGKSGFAWAENTAELDSAFNEIAQDLQRESSKHYILGYCSPKRKGDHEVTVKVRGYSGSLSHSFNADGFAGGCDPRDILEGFDPGQGQCQLSIEPAAVKKGLLLSKLMLLTITGKGTIFSSQSRVSIEDMTTMWSFAGLDRLIVLASLQPTAPTGTKDVSVTTGSDRLICYDLLTVE